MIGGFRSVRCVSVFPGSSLVIVIMIDSSEKHNCKESFFFYISHVCEKRSKFSKKKTGLHIPCYVFLHRYHKNTFGNIRTGQNWVFFLS